MLICPLTRIHIHMPACVCHSCAVKIMPQLKGHQRQQRNDSPRHHIPHTYNMRSSFCFHTIPRLGKYDGKNLHTHIIHKFKVNAGDVRRPSNYIETTQFFRVFLLLFGIVDWCSIFFVVLGLCFVLCNQKQLANKL